MSESTGAVGRLLTRRNILLVGVAIFAATFAILAGRSWGIVLSRLLTDGAIVLAWLAAAAGFGLAIPGIYSGLLRTTKHCVAIALGIGVMGFLTLALGLLGMLTMPVAWLMIATGIVCFAIQAVPALRHVNVAVINAWLNEPAFPESLAFAIAGVPIAMTVVAVFAPPGLLWGDEPNGYDVVEYHLQVPREWYEAHRVVPLTHNVFSYFPQGMEIHYLLAMHLGGGPWAGMYVAQLMHAAMIGLTVLSVIALAGARSERSSVVAGLAMITSPWLALLAPVGYVEGAMLLNGTLAIGLTMRALGTNGLKRDWLLAGVFAGLACGAKLTAAPMVLAAIPVATLVAWVVRREAVSLGTMIHRLMLFSAAGVITLSPWLARNFAWTHNPVFPEMTGLFGDGGGRFSGDQIERWQRANHVPAAALQGVGGRISELGHQVIFDWRYGFVLLPAALIAMVLTRSQRSTIFLATLLIVMMVFWTGFTHLQSRFLVLAIPVAALAIAQLQIDRWLRLIGVALFASLQVTSARFERQYVARGKILAVVTRNALLGVEKLDGLSGADLSNVPDEVTIALVGDAKAFFYSRAMAKLKYRTVFDAGASPTDWIQAWTGPVDANAAIVISPGELGRLSKTYWKIPPPPAEVLSRDTPFILNQ